MNILKYNGETQTVSIMNTETEKGETIHEKVSIEELEIIYKFKAREDGWVDLDNYLFTQLEKLKTVITQMDFNKEEFSDFLFNENDFLDQIAHDLNFDHTENPNLRDSFHDLINELFN